MSTHPAESSALDRETAHQLPDAAQHTLAALRRDLGDAVSVEPASLDEARADQSGHRASGVPLAVVTPRSIAEVQAVMRIATERRVPVVTRGAGTGLAGGAIATTGEIVLSTAALNRVIEISPDDELAVVEPGILNGDLNAVLAPLRLWFSPDPASWAISSVGGNIATNAGGLLCAKYGVTRESVLALKVVLADGTLMSLGHRSVKGVTGLDLAALLIGSEGTLGVIVEATLRLRPIPEGPPVTISAWFADVTAAAAASAAITANRIRPAAMELLDSLALRYIGEYLQLAVAQGGEVQKASPQPPGAHLLVQCDGPDRASAAAKVVQVLRSAGGTVAWTDDAAEGERLMAVRRSFHPALAATATVLIEDVCVPRSALPAMFDAIREIGERYRLDIPTVAHAGDGNLHPNFLFTGDEVPDAVWAAAGELFETALALGGTLTGEHGVGLLKRRWLAAELGEEQVELQRRIKRAFDPLEILNPGKVF